MGESVKERVKVGLWPCTELPYQPMPSHPKTIILRSRLLIRSLIYSFWLQSCASEMQAGGDRKLSAQLK